MKALDESSTAAIEAALKSAAAGDITLEEAIAQANAAALAANQPTRHPWIHPTKGWREHARQSKSNGRRKLDPRFREEAMSLRPVKRVEPLFALGHGGDLLHHADRQPHV